MDINNQKPRMKPMHILVVDDDADMLQILKSNIEERFGDDALIEVADNPNSARQCLDDNLIDILITDLEMPDISGLQLLRHAKRRNTWTQVVLITGHTALDALTDAMDLGASDYILKPLDPDELEELLRDAYARLHRWKRSLKKTLSFINAR